MYSISPKTAQLWEVQKNQTHENGNPLVSEMSEVDFLEIEKVYGYKLPAEYREFIANYECAIF